MAKVKRYSRTVHGRRRRVKGHNRVQPRRAGRHAQLAYQYARAHRKGDASMYLSLALLEISAWMMLRGTAFVLVTLGLAAVGSDIPVVGRCSAALFLVRQLM